jgi:hypothetical protein
VIAEEDPLAVSARTSRTAATLFIGLGLVLASLVASWPSPAQLVYPPEDTGPDRLRLATIGLALIPALFAYFFRRPDSYGLRVAGIAALLAALLSLRLEALQSLWSIVTGDKETAVGPVVLLLGALVVGMVCLSDGAIRLNYSARPSPTRRVRWISVCVVGSLVGGVIVSQWQLSSGERNKSRVVTAAIEPITVSSPLTDVVRSIWSMPADRNSGVRLLPSESMTFVVEALDAGGSQLVAVDHSGTIVWSRQQKSPVQLLVTDSGVPLLRADDVLSVLDPLTGNLKMTIPGGRGAATAGPWIVVANDRLRFHRVEDGAMAFVVSSNCFPEEAVNGDQLLFVACEDDSAIAVDVTKGAIAARYADVSRLSRVGDRLALLIGESDTRAVDMGSGLVRVIDSDSGATPGFLTDRQDRQVVWQFDRNRDNQIEITRLDTATLRPMGDRVKLALDVRDRTAIPIAISGDNVVVIPEEGIGTDLSPAAEAQFGISMYSIETGERLGSSPISMVLPREDMLDVEGIAQFEQATVAVFEWLVTRDLNGRIGVIHLQPSR